MYIFCSGPLIIFFTVNRLYRYGVISMFQLKKVLFAFFTKLLKASLLKWTECQIVCHAYAIHQGWSELLTLGFSTEVQELKNGDNEGWDAE